MDTNLPFTVTPTGLDITGQPDYEEWVKAGNTLVSMKSALCWSVGDWCNYGESAYGEKYAQALNGTDYDYGTLRNYASVCMAYPKLSRRGDISFSHHRVVVNLDMEERQHWLQIAVDEHLNRDEFKARVFGVPPAPDPDDKETSEPEPEPILVLSGTLETLLSQLQASDEIVPFNEYRIEVYEKAPKMAPIQNDMMSDKVNRLSV